MACGVSNGHGMFNDADEATVRHATAPPSSALPDFESLIDVGTCVVPQPVQHINENMEPPFHMARNHVNSARPSRRARSATSFSGSRSEWAKERAYDERKELQKVKEEQKGEIGEQLRKGPAASEKCPFEVTHRTICQDSL